MHSVPIIYSVPYRSVSMDSVPPTAGTNDNFATLGGACDCE